MIAKVELSKFYVQTSQSYAKEQRDGELKAWHDVLGEYRSADLDAALRRWQSDIGVDDFTGKPRGSRMPTAAELKLSIEQFNRQQWKQATGKFIPCNQCEGGWIRVFHGTTAGGNSIEPKLGALTACECQWEHLARHYGVPRADLRAKLEELQREQDRKRQRRYDRQA